MSNFASGIEFPKGKATRVAMCVVLASGLLTAAVHNLLGRRDLIAALVVDRDYPWQIYRILTAGLVGNPTNFLSSVLPLLSLFFLGSAIEARLGARRFALLLVASSVAAYGVTSVAYLAPLDDLGAFAPSRAAGSGPWTVATVVAWSMLYPEERIRLSFVLPVKGSMAKWIVLALELIPPLLYREPVSEGVLAIFVSFFFALVVTPRIVWWTRFLDPVWRNRARAGASDKRGASTRNRGGLRVLDGGRAARDDNDPPMLN
jgi:membrane associated rhomboid family serine protease